MTTKHDLTTGVVRGRQDDDGQPFLAFFDPDTQLGFCWNGHPESPIEVCHGGMGEPVIDETAPPFLNDGRNETTLREWVTLFEAACRRYITYHNWIEGQ